MSKTTESPQAIPQIIARARANPAAFEPLYVEYFPRIFRYCLRRVSSQPEAEDLTSLVFTRALTNLAQYRGGSFAAWLFQIAHNVVANHWRSQRDTVPLEDIAEVAGTEDDLLGRVMNDEEHRRLAHLIAALPDESRELLALKVAGGLSAKEIGQVIGKSETAVRMAISRIVRQLRMAWEQEKTQ